MKSIILTMCLTASLLTATDSQGQTAWSRDVFREIHLTEHPNTALYGSTGDDEGCLFNILFREVVNGNIPCYKYDINSTDRTDSITLTKPEVLLKDFHIDYRQNNGKIHIDSGDMPTAQVTMIYLRERVAYDIATSSFKRTVIALCPVITEQQYDGEQPQRYPLCWVRYADLKEVLTQTAVTDDLNNSIVLSLDEWFSLHFYQGNIYKIQSRIGNALKQYVHTQKEYHAEQQRINSALNTLQQQTYSAVTAASMGKIRK